MDKITFPAALICAFICVAILAQTAAHGLLQRLERAKRINRRLSMLGKGLSRQEVYARLVPHGLDQSLGSSAARRLALMLQQGAVLESPTMLLAKAGAAAGLLWLLAILLRLRSGPPTVLETLASLLGAIAVVGLSAWVLLTRRISRRRKEIERQMPIALDVMTRALRAGHPVISSIQLAGEEMGDPLGSEFGLVIDETTYGVELQTALAHFGERTGSDDTRFLAVAIAVQIETGGNLVGILEGLAKVIRSRIGLTQKVKALSSEGRTSALLLTALPLFVIAVQVLLHPHVYSDKFADPIFWPTVAVTAALYLLGWAVVHRIVNFRY